MSRKRELPEDIDLRGADYDFSALKTTDITAFNRRAEGAFVEMVTAWLRQSGDGGLSEGFIVQNAAFLLDVSPATVKRYLFKHSAVVAEFEVSEGVVRLRRVAGKRRGTRGRGGAK